jgi:hypothetical protein
MIETITPLIQNVGFPAAVTLWFMYRTEKVINRNTNTINKFCEVINKCKRK